MSKLTCWSCGSEVRRSGLFGLFGALRCVNAKCPEEQLHTAARDSERLNSLLADAALRALRDGETPVNAVRREIRL